eukprot:m.176131 g.176131  ORF g.176131 m.176131 type:complete len:802 (+) comp15337_c11_seq1:460-2865(+)
MLFAAGRGFSARGGALAAASFSAMGGRTAADVLMAGRRMPPAGAGAGAGVGAGAGAGAGVGFLVSVGFRAEPEPMVGRRMATAGAAAGAGAGMGGGARLARARAAGAGRAGGGGGAAARGGGGGGGGPPAEGGMGTAARLAIAPRDWSSSEAGGAAAAAAAVEEEVDPLALKNFNLNPHIVEALSGRGIETLFPIQAATFKPIVEGKDVLARARTGTGKTLSFVLPMVQVLLQNPVTGRRSPRVLVLAPTRELAKQTGKEFSFVGGKHVSSTAIYGGVRYEIQERDLERGVEVVIGTPGRIIDHIERGNLDLSKIQHIVLDEADRMLDMGFAEDVEKILQLHKQSKANKPQVLMFSATIPPFIKDTVHKFMDKSHEVIDMVGDDAVKTADKVEHYAVRCSPFMRANIIADLVQVHRGPKGRVMIFCETKQEATELSMSGLKAIAQVLHGDIQQRQRDTTLDNFREGKFRCLIATDVAARGLDIPEVDLVIQCQPPRDVDSYVHRAGRTGRAGRSGKAICLYHAGDFSQLKQAARHAGIRFKQMEPPTDMDIVKCTARDAAEALNEVPKEICEMYREAAEELLEGKDPVDMLAASLACTSHATHRLERSLLTQQPGMRTFVLRLQDPTREPHVIFASVGRYVSNMQASPVSARVSATREEVVFDLPVESAAELVGRWNDSTRMTLTEAKDAKDLPAFDDALPLAVIRAKPTRNDRNHNRNQSGGGFRDRGDGGARSGNREGGAGFDRRRDGYSDRRRDGGWSQGNSYRGNQDGANRADGFGSRYRHENKDQSRRPRFTDGDE